MLQDDGASLKTIWSTGDNMVKVLMEPGNSMNDNVSYKISHRFCRLINQIQLTYILEIISLILAN